MSSSDVATQAMTAPLPLTPLHLSTQKLTKSTVVFYNAEQAPDWHEGAIAMICMGIFLGFVTAGCVWGQFRQEKQDARARGDSFADSESTPEKLDVDGESKL